jgi:hypothetical protein
VTVNGCLGPSSPPASFATTAIQKEWQQNLNNVAMEAQPPPRLEGFPHGCGPTRREPMLLAFYASHPINDDRILLPLTALLSMTLLMSAASFECTGDEMC